MKKLSKIKLQDAVALEDREMKTIFGGSGGGSGECCAYNTNYLSSGFTCVQGGATAAMFMAGSNGWWACNTEQVIEVCC